MMFVRRLRAQGRVVGLHDINNRTDVNRRGKIDIQAGHPLILNRDRTLFQGDNLAVNILAADGQYEGELVGHVTITYTDPTRNLNWAHYLSALLDGDNTRLPTQLYGLRERIRMEGETIEKTTHRPDGSQIAVFILFEEGESEEIMVAVENYLRTSGMEIERT